MLLFKFWSERRREPRRVLLPSLLLQMALLLHQGPPRRQYQLRKARRALPVNTNVEDVVGVGEVETLVPKRVPASLRTKQPQPLQPQPLPQLQVLDEGYWATLATTLLRYEESYHSSILRFLLSPEHFRDRLLRQ